MYGIADSIDWNFLLGKETLQVCIGLHQIVLNFDDNITINIECEFEHEAKINDVHVPQALSTRASTLVSLLGNKVTDATAENDKTLILSFSNREVLRIHDSNESYESFQVVTQDKDIIV